MPEPTERDLHVDALLTQLSIGYTNSEYIADQIFPIVPVMKRSDIVPKYDQSHWFRSEAKLRGPRTRSEGGGYTVDTSDTYYCARYSFRDEIADEERDNADSIWNLDATSTEFVTDKIQMVRERAFASDSFTTSVWGNDETGGTDFTQWSDYAGSNPLIDATTYMDEVESRVGREANTLVIGKQVWNAIKWHPALVDSIKGVERGIITEQLAAALLGIDRLLIGRSIFTSSPEGTAEASVTYSRIWGKNALFLYVPDRPSLRRPAAGYTFVWQRVPNAIQYIVRHRDDERETDIIEGNTYFAQKVTAARAGTFLSGVVA